LKTEVAELKNKNQKMEERLTKIENLITEK
jgi:hypothetical protein